jgi:sarcosine oxidase, subunit beta
MTYDVIVIGAGITGSCTAYELKRQGAGRVLLIERGQPASVGTGKSAAIVRQHYSTPLMAGLARDSVALFEAMPEALGRPVGFVQSGYYFLVPADSVAAARKNVAMQKGIGIDTGIHDPADLDLPWLNPEGVAIVVHEPKGGYADPVQTTEAHLARFEELGGEVRLKTPVRGLVREGDRITGVQLDDGRVHGGLVVNAAGPFAPMLAASAGLDLPMRSVREQDTVWQARPGRPLPAQSISNAVDAIYLRPLGEGRYIAGRGFPKDYVDVDPYNLKETPDDDFVTEVQERMELRFPPLQGATLVTAYAALYDVTPDWYPFVGPRAGLDGYADASGGSGHGFKIAPAIARTLAAWLLEGSTGPEFARLSHDRIGKGELFVQSYGGNRG